MPISPQNEFETAIVEIDETPSYIATGKSSRKENTYTELGAVSSDEEGQPSRVGSSSHPPLTLDETKEAIWQALAQRNLSEKPDDLQALAQLVYDNLRFMYPQWRDQPRKLGATTYGDRICTLLYSRLNHTKAAKIQEQIDRIRRQ